MDSEKSTPIDQSTNPSPSDAPSRRGFLGGFGALGLATVAAMMDVPQANASALQAGVSTPKLSSVDKVKVIRDEKYDVPGGQEHIVEYVASDPNGATVRHSYNLSRIKESGTYTMSANFRVEKFALGQSLNETAASVETLQMSIYGIEGEVSGNRRKDTVTTTIVGTDGEITRKTQIVPVRLDLSEFDGLDTAALAAKMGNIHLGNQTLGK